MTKPKQDEVEEPITRIEYAKLDSAVGPVWAARTDVGLLSFAVGAFDLRRLQRACARDDELELVENESGWEDLLEFLARYFRGEVVSYDETMDLRGIGEFSRRVLDELQRIPHGETRSYGEVGGAMGNPRYSRAVGRACAANPLPIIIPCHRVVPARGGLGGYSGPPGWKRRLLDLEGASAQTQIALDVSQTGEETPAPQVAFTPADLSGDWHVHPNFSIDADADATVGAFCERAVEIGLPSVCFTTHADLNPKRAELDGWVRVNGRKTKATDEAFGKYCEAVLRAKDDYSQRGLNVHLGIEIDYGQDFEETIAEYLQRHPFEFVVGAVHCAFGHAVSSRKEAPKAFRNREPKAVSEAYFSDVAALARSGLADVIGHLDILFRNASKANAEKLFTAAESHLDECLSVIAQAGLGVEVNTSGLRHDYSDTHPSLSVLVRCAAAGVPVVTLGSDAHRVDELASGFDEARAKVSASGVTVRPYLIETGARARAD
jgi:HisJ family histidinol phosphate phosphatase